MVLMYHIRNSYLRNLAFNSRLCRCSVSCFDCFLWLPFSKSACLFFMEVVVEIVYTNAYVEENRFLYVCMYICMYVYGLVKLLRAIVVNMNSH